MTREGIVANNREITQAVPMRVSGKTIQILLAIIATILAIAALKATSAITIPLAFAFFIAVLVHPLQR